MDKLAECGDVLICEVLFILTRHVEKVIDSSLWML